MGNLINKNFLLLSLLTLIMANCVYGVTIEKIIETNAHEGPVCVPWQNRLYFTTKPKFYAKKPIVSIKYIDLHTKK